MGTINRIPRGLLSLLDSQTQGQNPDSMGDVIAPVTDLGDLLASAKGTSTEQNTASNVLVISAGQAPIVVPQGEIWLVRLATAQVFSLESGLNAACNLAFQASTTQSRLILSSVNVTNVANTGAYVSAPAVFTRPFVASGGNVFTAELPNIIGLPVLGFQLVCTVNFIRLQG